MLKHFFLDSLTKCKDHRQMDMLPHQALLLQDIPQNLSKGTHLHLPLSPSLISSPLPWAINSPLLWAILLLSQFTLHLK